MLEILFCGSVHTAAPDTVSGALPATGATTRVQPGAVLVAAATTTCCEAGTLLLLAVSVAITVTVNVPAVA